MPSVQPNRTKVALASLGFFCASLILTAYSAKHPQVARLGSAVVTQVLSPIQALYQWSYNSTIGVVDEYVLLVGVKRENKELADRLAALQGENSRLLELQHESQRLRELLSVVEAESLNGVTARITGYDPTNWSQTVSIDHGLIHGLAIGQAVIAAHGIVGQIIAVSPSSAKVLLIIDHGSGVDAILQGGRARGVIEGAGSLMTRWSFVSPEEEIKVGDRVITSGMDGVFPKGLMIGVVSGIDEGGLSLFRSVEVKPAVQFSKLETVFVIIPTTQENTNLVVSTHPGSTARSTPPKKGKGK